MTPKEWQPKNPNHNIHWTAKTRHADITTGELLSPEKIQNENYIKVTTAKDYKINKHRTKGTIEYTILYERSRQQRLFE